MSSEQTAALYIQNERNSKRWKVGWIERSGTAFWSEDSKHLFLRDEYAADDTKIRVFHITGAAPKEIKGLDDKIRKSTLARIPENETTQWLYYPRVCFAANDSSTIIVVADAPLVPKMGSGSGKPFRLTLTVNLNTLKVVDSAPAGSPPRSPGQESPGPVAAPTGWHKVDAVAFSLFAPLGWEFRQLQGVDSYVGEFVSEGAILKFDFGAYSNPLKEEKKPKYVVVHKSIGGLRAKIVSPTTPGHGVTAVYFPRAIDSNKLCLYGQDLAPAEQDLALKIFETIRFGKSLPSFVVPPPPPAAKNAQ
jgi:hypothetical protein